MHITEQDLFRPTGAALGSTPRRYPEGAHFRAHPEHVYQGQRQNPRRRPFALDAGTARNSNPEQVDAETLHGMLEEQGRIGRVL